MKFEYSKLPVNESCVLRNRFIDTFVDTSHEQYVRHIQDIKTDTVVDSENYMCCYLWNYLTNKNRFTVDFYSIIRNLCSMKQEQVFVMWDIRPAKVIYQDGGTRVRMADCWSVFRSDDIISVSPRNLGDVLFWGHAIEAHRMVDVLQQILPEDLYVFDNSFTWYIAFTHEEYTPHNEKRLCFSNIKKIEPLTV